MLLYTMVPVFSLVLDRDINEDAVLLYPELYKELRVADAQSESVATSLRKKGQIPKETTVNTIVHYMHQQAN